MNFRNLYKIIIAACLIVMTGSCKKLLDQQPITDVGPNVVFTDVSSAYKALVGVYSRLTGDAGYGIRLSLYYPLDNDEMQGPSGAVDNDRRDIARYSASSTNAQLSGPFNQLFQGISFANICIDEIPKMGMYSGGNDQEKKQLQRMYGEALTLRAQFYFEAIRNWGDLPSHFLPSYAQASENPFPLRTDRDTLYNQIIADLKVAEDLIPWRNEVASIGDQIDERITKGAVKGLRARIALFRGGYSLRQSGGMKRSPDYLNFYQIAKDECNDIITSGQHSLNPSYKSLWRDQVCAHTVADPNGELMFQATGSGLGATEDTKLGYYNGPRVNNLGNSSINPLASYFYLFDSTDLRRDVTIAPYFVAVDGATKIGQAITAINDGKYRRDWITNPAISPTGNGQYFSLKWQILRYSDVLLMFAEAENELNGPTAAAYNAINMVRRRGYGVSISTANPAADLTAGLAKGDFFKVIVRERSLELGGEGIRKYDLIRWNLLAAAITDTRTNLTNMAASTGAPVYSYMAGPPAYVSYVNPPTTLYYFAASKADDKSIWGNSFYNNFAAFTDPSATYNTQAGNYTLATNEYGVIIKGTANVVTLPNATASSGKVYWVKFSPNNPKADSTKAWTYNMKVNTSSSQTYDNTTSNSFVYSGSVAATGTGNPPALNGPSLIKGFYSNGSGWFTLTGVNWFGAAINTTSLARFATGFATGRSELLPIPQAARDANINLTQNPGY